MSSAEELKNVLGVFVIIGSRDLPLSYPYDKPFGFNEGNDIPIFKYSLNEVMNGFTNPQLLTRPGILNNNTINMLIAEGENNSGLSSQNISDSDWDNVYKILEWVSMNQATILSVNNWPEKTQGTYTSFPDYVFRTTVLSPEFNTNLANYIPTYVSKSFVYVESTKRDRISLIEFRIRINNIPKLFKVYYDIDDFMSMYASSLFFVYYYQDLDDDTSISQEEMDKQIVDAINKGIMKETFNTCKQIFTPYCEPIYSEGVIIDHKLAVNRSFWIYSNLPSSELTEEVLLDQVRAKLIEDNGGTDDDLSNQYPNLFVTQEVHIYPIHDNTAFSKNDNSLLTVHPIAYTKIQDIMKMFGLGLITTANNFRNVEIFYTGIDAIEVNILNKFIYPLLAAEFSADKTRQPISSRFIDYSPRSFASFDGTGSNSDKFQFIIMNCLGYFEKNFSEEALLNNISVIKDNIDFRIHQPTETNDYETITFTMVNTKFTITWYTNLS